MKLNVNNALKNAFENFGMSYEEYYQTISEKYKPRWDKNLVKVNLTEEQTLFLSENSIIINILVFSCDFCPDCASAIPVLQTISDYCDCINWRIVDRDADKELFQKYRVNNKGLIPTVLFLNKEYDEVTRWIERSSFGYELVFKARKEALGKPVEEFSKVKSALFKENSKKLTKENVKEILYMLKRAVYITNASELANQAMTNV